MQFLLGFKVKQTALNLYYLFHIMVSFDCFYTCFRRFFLLAICVGKITIDFLIADCKLKGVIARGVAPLRCYGAMVCIFTTFQTTIMKN